MEFSAFDALMDSQGWVVFERVVPATLVARMKADVAAKEAVCAEWMHRRGLAATEGAAHHILGGDTSLDEFMCALYLDAYLERWFGGPYILNSFGASVTRAGADGSSYLAQMHRDLRSFSNGYHLLLNMLVMLDDFRLENGATYVLSGSHRSATRPEIDDFRARAERLTGMAGSIALFDSNLWHAAGANRSDAARSALTLTFSRPFFKQQMDYPRFLGEDYMAAVPERVRQVLGYYARTPSSYDEWYRPRETRMYRADQG
jgi:ectoine hydroxylase-related dioxygenase (phytanoyl-CoA dioxygenase family)